MRNACHLAAEAGLVRIDLNLQNFPRLHGMHWVADAIPISEVHWPSSHEFESPVSLPSGQ